LCVLARNNSLLFVGFLFPMELHGSHYLSLT
jgi:hypothetical protein